MLSVAGTIELTSGGIKFLDGTVQSSAAVASGANNTMVANWPDTIICNITNPNNGLTTFYYYNAGNFGIGTTNPGVARPNSHPEL